MDRILVVDANARLKGRRLTTLDVIGVGPRLITALLKYYGFDAELHPYENVIKSEKHIKDFDVIAISFMISDVIAVRRLIKSWRKVHGKNELVVLGGAGALSDKALRLLDFDIAFLGEAEPTFYHIFRHQGYKSFKEFVEDVRNRGVVIRGTAVKTDRGIIDGGLAPWSPKDLLFKVIPEINDVSNYPFFWACRVYVEIVRGCSNFRRPLIMMPNLTCLNCDICKCGELSNRVYCPVGIPPGCGYCNVPLIHGYPRSREIYSIAEEIRKLLELGVTRITLSAPDFLDYGRELNVGGILTDPCEPRPNIDMIERLLKEITNFNAVLEGKAAILIENIKACLVDDYVAELLGRYLKGSAIYIGLESCSDKLLNVIGRPFTCRDTLRAIELLSKYGLKPYVYLIHGLPHENADDIKKTVDIIPYLEKIGVERIVLYKFIPLPRTAFNKRVKKEDNEYLKYVGLLKNSIRKFNEFAKRRLVGRIIDVVTASEYPRDRRYLISYPLFHGPVTLLKLPKRFIGYIVRARITKVISDRVVLGELMHIRYRVTNLDSINT